MRGMVIDNEYDIGETVFLITDPSSGPRVVSAITIRPGNALIYETCQGVVTSSHWAFELSKEQVLTTTSPG